MNSYYPLRFILIILCFSSISLLFGQTVTFSDTIFYNEESVSPLGLIKSDSAYFLFLDRYQDYSYSTEIHRFTKELQSTQNVIYLDGHIDELHFKGFFPFRNKLFHLSELESKDSIKYFLQNIDLSNGFKSRNVAFILSEKEPKVFTQVERFYTSRDSTQLALVQFFVQRFSKNVEISITHFNEDLTELVTNRFDLGASARNLIFRNIHLNYNGNLLMLLGTDFLARDGKYQLIEYDKNGSQRVIKEFEGFGDVRLYNIKNNQLLVGCTIDNKYNEATQGILFFKFNSADLKLVDSYFRPFDFEFFKKQYAIRTEKKLIQDLSNGKTIAKDRLSFSSLFLMDDGFILELRAILDVNMNNNRLATYYVYYDSNLEMQWAHRLVLPITRTLSFNKEKGLLELIYKSIFGDDTNDYDASEFTFKVFGVEGMLGEGELNLGYYQNHVFRTLKNNTNENIFYLKKDRILSSKENELFFFRVDIDP